MNTILDFDQALDRTLALAQEHFASAQGNPALPQRSYAPGLEEVPLEAALNRVLAQDLRADRDQPPFPRVTRDGFALVASASPTRTVIGELRAGELWRSAPLAANDAVEIMTGAPLPSGADAVVMLEHVDRHADLLTIAPDRLPSAGQNFVPAGAEARAGSVALPRGTRIDPAAVAVAASLGHAKLSVYRRPQVAIIATGDEVVELDRPPAAHQIRNSNSYSLAALVQAGGGTPVRLPIARDTRADLEHALAEARRSDLVLFSGGVSMGKYDLVEAVLAEAGAIFHFTGVRMQPGKPVVLGSFPAGGAALAFFGLPGNPVSTEVTFHCFVAPYLRTLAGEAPAGPFFAQATLAEAVEGRPGLMRLLPARLEHSRQQPRVRLVPWQSSGDLGANSRANCYAVFPPERPGSAPGDVISILLR